ncbi:MAG: pilin [Candidatus Pacebacteria bacterium]|nr:pilin [Candidatus Paceibacterota bacterium]
MKKNRLIISLSFFFLFLLSGVAFAEEMADFYDKIKISYEFLVKIGSGIGVLMVTYGGIKIFFSGGNAAKASEGRRVMLGAFFGLTILVGSYTIIHVINPKILEPGSVNQSPAPESSIYGLYIKDNNTGKEMLLKNSVTSLGNFGMDNKVDGYYFKQKDGDESEKFAAIFFSDTDYKGECYYSGEDATKNGAPPFKPSSIFVFRTVKAENGGPIMVYNNDNGECKDLDKIGESFYPETTVVGDYSQEYVFMGDDGKHWVEASSMKIPSKNILVLIKTRSNKEKKTCTTDQEEGGASQEIPNCYHCQLVWKTSDSEDCFPIKYDYVYHTDAVKSMKPGIIKLFQRMPTDNLY